MDKQSAITAFGSAKALAEALRVSPAAVSQWTAIPVGRQYQIEVLTNGELKADPPSAGKAA